MKQSTKAMREQGINFLHFRPKNEDGTFAAKGGETVAYVVVGDTVRFSTATCRTKDVRCDGDRFNRKLGAMISGGRLSAYRESVYVPSYTGKAAIKEFISHITAGQRMAGLYRNSKSKRLEHTEMSADFAIVLA